MALVFEFEKSGNWLFKRRSWLPVALIVPAIIVMAFEDKALLNFNLAAELIFLSISILGEVIRILTIGFIYPNTSGRNTKLGQVAEELNVTGIYSIIRHPLYLGNFFMWLGPIFFIRSVWFTLIVMLAYWIYYERIMFSEEQFLRRKFGEIYDKWSERVPPFIPRFSKFTPPALPFSLRFVLRREYNSFFNIFVIFTLLDAIRNYLLFSKFQITTFWLYLFAAGFTIWIVLRTIDKQTKWLAKKEV